MTRDPAPLDGNAIFVRSARAMADALRGLARERENEPEAVEDLNAAADAIERALKHLG